MNVIYLFRKFILYIDERYLFYVNPVRGVRGHLLRGGATLCPPPFKTPFLKKILIPFLTLFR